MKSQKRSCTKRDVRGIFMSEKSIIKTARFHHITAGMRFAEFILKETEGLTQIPPLAELRIPAKTLAGILWRYEVNQTRNI